MDPQRHENREERVDVLVAIWGNPVSWGLAHYHVGEESEDSCRQSCAASRTSLEVLVRHLRPNRTIIVTLDTLSTSLGSMEGNYSQLLASVSEGVKQWIREESEASELTELVEKGRVKVEVIPGLGSFRGWRFGVFQARAKGRESVNIATSTYSDIMRIILQALHETRSCSLAMDLTHGLNYTQVLAYKAALTAASLHTLATNCPNGGVEVRFYNSEPYSQHANLRMHLIQNLVMRREQVIPELLARALSNPYSLKNLHKTNQLLPAESSRELSNSIKNSMPLLLKELGKLMTVPLKSIYYSFPLALIKSGEEILGTLQSLVGDKDSSVLADRLVKESLKYLDVIAHERKMRSVVDGEENTVKPALAFDNSMVENFLTNTFFASYILEVLGKTSSDRLEYYDEGYDVEDLKNIVEYLNPYTRKLAKNEVDFVLYEVCRNCEEKLQEGRKCPFTEDCSSLEEWTPPVSTNPIDERNFVAHGGLERNVTQIKRVGSKLYVRYVPERWGDVKKMIERLGIR